MRTMFRGERAEGLDLAIDIDLGREHLRATIQHETLDVRRRPADAAAAAATLTSTPEVLAAVLYTGHRLKDALAEGAATIEGETAAVEAFTHCFELPPPARGDVPSQDGNLAEPSNPG